MHGLARGGDTGVIVNRIQPAILFQGFLHRLFHLDVTRHVADDSQMIRAKFRNGFRNPVFIDGDHDHLCAFGDISFRAITSNAARAPREENDFVLEQ
jgi:hypothetical protein